MAYKSIGTRRSKANSTISSSSVSFNNPTNDGLVISGQGTTPGNMVHSMTPVSGSADYDIDVPTLLGGTTSGMYIRKIVILDTDNTTELDDLAIGLSGGTVNIYGRLFTSTCKVYFNGAQVTTTYVSATQLTATIPAAVNGSYHFAVVDSANSNAAMYIPGLRSSGFPTWGTTSYDSLGNNVNAQLVAFGDTPMTYRIVSGSLPSGVTMDITGKITGTVSAETTTTITVVADDYQKQSTQASVTITFRLADTQFPSVVTGVLNDTTAGAANKIIIDSARGTPTTTVNGSPTQGTFSPYGNDWSVYFGTSDLLSVANTTAQNLSSNNFTIEFFMNFHKAWSTSAITVMQKGRVSQGNFEYAVNLIGSGSDAGAIQFEYSTNGTSDFTINSSSVTLKADVWYHIAIVRSGTSLTFWLNGTNVGTSSLSATIGTTTSASTIGGNPGGSNYFNGFLSNMRVVNGTAVYSGAFTPSTSPLTAIANTAYLIASSNRLIDKASVTTLSIGSGTPLIKAFNPFGVERNAYTIASNQGSIFFNGTGSNVAGYLTAPNSVANFGSGDFTAEAWVYFSTVSAGYQPILANTGTADQQGWMMYMDTTNKLAFQTTSNNTAWTAGAISSFTPTVNTWTHVALVRSGSTITLYANGTSVASASISGAISTVSNTFRIGHYPYFSAGTVARSFAGHIYGVRLTNNAVYTSAFTATRQQMTPISGTAFLACTSSQAVTLESSGNNVTITAVTGVTPTFRLPYTVTDTSTATSTYGGSMYFNGSPDYIVAADPLGDAFSGNVWSIEGWIYSLSNTTTTIFLTKRASASGVAPILLGVYSGVLTGYMSSNGSSWDIMSGNNLGTIPVNQWTHFALTRNGNNFSSYINGVRANNYNPANLNFGTTTGWTIGGDTDGAAANYFNGYLSDLRVNQASTPYDPSATTITVPTAPLKALTNTTLLMRGTNGSVLDMTRQNNYITNGSVAVSTTQSKFGGKSMTFNGSTDSITVPANVSLVLGSGDCTIEGWFYPTAQSSTHVGISCSTASSSTGWFFGHANSAWRVVNGSAVIVSGGTVTLNAWTHVAFVRSGNTYTLYVNGTSVATSTTMYSFTDVSNLTVGLTPVGTYYSGYIDDFRITRGVARYVANFTPPTFGFAGQ